MKFIIENHCFATIAWLQLSRFTDITKIVQGQGVQLCNFVIGSKPTCHIHFRMHAFT